MATICTKAGRLAVMAQNPSNAIVHLGHSNGEWGGGEACRDLPALNRSASAHRPPLPSAAAGTVTLWSPSAKAPLARMLCHQGAVRAVAVDPSGR